MKIRSPRFPTHILHSVLLLRNRYLSVVGCSLFNPSLDPDLRLGVHALESLKRKTSMGKQTSIFVMPFGRKPLPTLKALYYDNFVVTFNFDSNKKK